MNRRALFSMFALVLLLGVACSSLNQVTPKGADDAAIEAEVRARIATSVPEKTFAVEVQVAGGVVTLSGHAANAEDRTKIGDAARQVEGVKGVINNITIQ